ncbi:MAG: histidine phosphatase family protein [Candidatus Accumulibacter sp.]|uniref:histidine phosphatase family protein n=1 Tax=Accumulibacter sp. TaxID=2053492 RepID=UPI0019EBD806|nr:histidine phosphatase family protein [Accumulibacter sp.]MBE2257923.1 histidine phosphatase family protein [Paracoccaceae bacterium]MCB1942612.1 histidine phosphatase family protein [Accumulibacter sp.]MCP5247794.1 histidine phosphatase family protein [Accumulibacter sp.]
MKERTLLVLRHGKSDWTTGEDDYDRPLVSRGRLGSRKMGAWIRSTKRLPDLVLSSPAERARQTTEAACRAMGLPLKKVRWDERIYAAPLEFLLAALADCPKGARRVLLVGHNPGLEYLIEYLADGGVETPADGKILPTSALAELTVLDDWAKLGRGCASLVSVIRPGEVPDDLAMADEDPVEEVDGGPVPDYFYTQSAVLPYRRFDGALQIMVIASRKGTRWVIPKGVKEPDLSLRDSASKEALEEAGIRGRLDEQPIGHYEYAKWGGVCTVAVFPMEVSESVPEEEWEESHRERRWLAPRKARRLLDESALGKLVDKLARKLAKR